MNILILGSGGREHALAWKLTKSKTPNKLFIAPGNAGTSQLGTNLNIDINDFFNVKKEILKYAINLIIVGPEVPLVNGFHDFVSLDKDLKHVRVIGPKKNGAQLEGSKKFAKEFMFRHHIPTAKYKSFTAESLNDGYKFLEALRSSLCIKSRWVGSRERRCYFRQSTKSQDRTQRNAI